MKSHYTQRLAENRTRLIQMLHMRRAGNDKTTAYKKLKTIAIVEYRILTAEAMQYHRIFKKSLSKN